MRLQHFLVAFAPLLILDCSAFSSGSLTDQLVADLTDPFQNREEVSQHKQPRRQLQEVDYQYQTETILQWETHKLLSQAKITAVAEEAKTFIARNLPVSGYNGSNSVVAIGILSAAVEWQHVDTTDSPAKLWVQLQVQGLVIADDLFDAVSFDFAHLIDIAITVRNNEFRRLMAPLVVSMHDEEEDNNNHTAPVLISVSIVCAAIVTMIIAKGVQRWRAAPALKHSNLDEASSETVPGLALPDRSDDSICAQSLYTIGATTTFNRTESSTFHRRDSAMHGRDPDNQNISWSFSVSSDVNPEFDTRSTDDSAESSPNVSSPNTMEQEEEVAAIRDFELLEDISLTDSCKSKGHDIEEGRFVGDSTMCFSKEVARTSTFDSSLSMLSTNTMVFGDVDCGDKAITEKGEGNKKVDDAVSSNGRLIMEDVDSFEDYVRNLPAPYRFQRSPSELKWDRNDF